MKNSERRGVFSTFHLTIPNGTTFFSKVPLGTSNVH